MSTNFIKLSAILFALLSLTPSVYAHGILQDISIDNHFFKGHQLNSQSIDPTQIRVVTSQDPIKGANNPNMVCGTGAKPAPLVADAVPGSNISFAWHTADGGRWPHDTGPMQTYLTNCGASPCSSFDTANAKWFKISEVGRKPDDPSRWVQADLGNNPATVQLPTTLAPGNYLVRHEIIALHLAKNMGGAEFYAGCAQLRVGGNQTGAPQDNELVSLPGAYKDTDPGILVDAYDSSVNYTFPGPAVSKLAATNTTTNTTSPTPSPTPSPHKGSCYLQAQRKAIKAKRDVHKPRRVSRVMKPLMMKLT